MKLKALCTAEVIREKLQERFAEQIEFTYDGYYLDHEVMPHAELIRKVKGYDILICEYDTVSRDVIDSALHLTDALGSVNDRMVNRDDYFLIQAPDAYRFRELFNCFNPDNPCGHPAVQLPPSARGRNIFRDGEVFKVTHPSDVEISELMLRRRSEK